MRLLIGLLALFSFGTAHAECPPTLPDNTICVEWQAPTQYIDGSPIEAGELASYRVYWRTDLISPYSLAASINIPNGDATELTTPIAPLTIASPGPAGGTVPLYLVVTVTDIDDDESVFSNEVMRNIPFPDTRGEPNPPTLINVIINVVTS